MSYHSTHKLCAGAGAVITGAAITVSMFLCTLPVGFIQPSYAFGAETSNAQASNTETSNVGTFGAETSTAERSTAGTTASAISGTTYYVSATHGDDGNSGTDSSHPWKTLDKVNAVAPQLKPGDAISLERGSIFDNQSLRIENTTGSEQAPITIGAYGDTGAPKPIVSANGAPSSHWEQNYRGYVGNHKNTERCPRLFCCAMSRISS